MKSIIAAGILLSASAPAFAGPYANIENNASFLGDEFGGSVTEVHAGVELGDFYLQGGPAFFAVAGDEGYVEYSAKVGVSTALSEDLSVYGELSAITTDKEIEFSELAWGSKVGLTYKF